MTDVDAWISSQELGFVFSRLTRSAVCKARALRARKTLRPRFSDFFTDFEKKNPTVLQSIVLLSNFFLKLGIINIHNMNFKKMKKKAMKKLGSPCLFTRRKALKLGYFHWFALKIQIAFIQN